MAASDPVSEGFLVRMLTDMREHVDGGHGRVRGSLNELKLDMNLGFKRAADQISEFQKRMEDHSGRLLVIETERATEKEALKTRRQDHRDRTVLLTTLTSILVTIGIFLLKAVLHL